MSRTAALVDIRLAVETDKILCKVLCRGICRMVKADGKDRK